MNKVKKIFAVIFAIMAVLLMSTAVWAEVTKYNLYICEKQVTSDNAKDILGDGVFSYDPNNNILTVKGNINAKVEQSYNSVIENHIDGLVIKIASDSVINFNQGNFINFSNNTVLTGPGKLTVGSGSNSILPSSGFYFQGLDDGSHTTYPNLTIENTNIDMYVHYGFRGQQGKDTDLKLINSQISVSSSYEVFSYIHKLEFENCAVTSPEGAIVKSACVYKSDGITPAKSVVIAPKSNYSFVSDTTIYNLSVGGVDVSGENADNVLGDGKVKYVPEENVLYLYGDINSESYGIKNGIENLTINVVNDCTMNTDYVYGIKCEENTTITGDGTLTVISPYNIGIYLDYHKKLNVENSNLVIRGGEGITGYGGYRTALNINNSYIDITASKGSAINLAQNDDNATVNINGVIITTPADAVIKSGNVYENDGKTPAQRIVIKPYYIVTFDVNGGSESIDEVKVGKGEKLVLPNCAPPTEGYYEFIGWKINNTVYKAGVSVTPQSNITAMAQWKKYCRVSFDNNGGNGSISDVYVAKGESYTLPKCELTPPFSARYRFKGWKVNGTVYNVGDTITVNSDTTAVAQWQRYYLVRYYPNNGTTQVKQHVIDDGITTSLLSYENCNFTKPAYKDFDHWEIDGEEYKPGDKITVTKDTDVYAVYKDRLYAVSFDTAGLCTPPETQYIAYGGTVTDPGTPFAKGYTFIGWYKNNSFEDIYKVGDFSNSMYAVTGDTVYYACFKEAVDDYVEVTGFDTNIHSGMSYYKASDYLSVPDGVDYRVGGINWYASDGSWSNSNKTDESVSFTAGKDYYAEIIILPNSGLTFGSGTINDKLVSLNNGQSLIDFEKSTFGSNKIELATKPITATGSCTIMFMNNGGTGNMDDVKVAQGMEFILPECAFTAPEGKYFVGWAQSNYGFEFDPVGDMIDAGDSVTPTANNMFFFAQWADKGDVNADGKITDADAALVLKFISGTTTLTSGQLEMAKMNGDDVVDMLDVIAILNNKTA